MTKEEAKEFIVQSIKDDVDVAKIADAIRTLELTIGRQYEKFLPCTCGCNRRSEWTSYKKDERSITLVCMKCGKTACGKNRADAKRNWNKMIEDELNNG